jgi:hypothetical protein
MGRLSVICPSKQPAVTGLATGPVSIFSPMVQRPLVDECLLNTEASRSYSDISHSVGHLWMRDQLSQRTLPDNTQQQETSIPNVIRTRNPSKRAAADPRLRPRGHWDRQLASTENGTLIRTAINKTGCPQGWNVDYHSRRELFHNWL